MKKVKLSDIFLPYYILFEIFNFYLKKITKETKPYELYGKLSSDPTKTVHFFFRSLSFKFYLRPSDLTIYLSINKLIYLDINRHGGFESKNRVYENLESIKVTYYHLNNKYNLDLDFNKVNFPKLKSLHLRDENHNALNRPNRILNVYPSTLCVDSSLQLNDEYFYDSMVKNISFLLLCNLQITGRNWKPLKNLILMHLHKCPNITDKFFEENSFKKLEGLSIENLKITGKNWKYLNLKKLHIFKCEDIHHTILKKFQELESLLIHNDEINLTYYPKSLKIFKCTTKRYISRELLNYVSHIKELYLTSGTFNIDYLNVFPNLIILKLRCFTYFNRTNIFDKFSFPKLKILECNNLNEGNNYNIKNFIKLKVLELRNHASLPEIFEKVKFNYLEKLFYVQGSVPGSKWRSNFPKLKKLKIIKKYNNLPIFNYFIFPILTKLTIKSNKSLNLNDIKRFNPSNFKRIKILKVKHQRSFVDLLLSMFEFKQLEKLTISLTFDEYNNWKKLPKLKKLRLNQMDLFNIDTFKKDYPEVKIKKSYLKKIKDVWITFNSINVI